MVSGNRKKYSVTRWVVLGIVMSVWDLTGVAAQEVSILPGSEGLAQWQFSPGAEFPGASGHLKSQGNGSVVLVYDFTRGGAYVGAYYTFKDPALIKALYFRARKPEAATITVRVTDSQGQTFQKSVLQQSADWCEYQCRMGNWTGHWGGSNDGRVRPPFRQIGFLVEKTGLMPRGQVEISQLTYDRGTAEPSVTEGNGLRKYQVSNFGTHSGFSVSGGQLKNQMWSVDFSKVSSSHLGHSLSLRGQPKTLAMTVQSDAPGAVLKLRVGSHFQTFEREIGTLTGGLQTLTVPAPPTGWRYFGGESDGNVHPPLRVSSLILEKGTCGAKSVQVELISLTCETVASEAEAIVLLSNMVSEGSQVTVTCQGQNLLDRPVTGTLGLTVVSWDEEN